MIKQMLLDITVDVITSMDKYILSEFNRFCSRHFLDIDELVENKRLSILNTPRRSGNDIFCIFLDNKPILTFEFRSDIFKDNDKYKIVIRPAKTFERSNLYD